MKYIIEINCNIIKSYPCQSNNKHNKFELELVELEAESNTAIFFFQLNWCAFCKRSHFMDGRKIFVTRWLVKLFSEEDFTVKE